MRKEQKNMLWVILAILVGLYLGNYYGLFDFGTKLTLTPVEDTCASANDLCLLEYNNEFNCPGDVDFCKVQGLVDCTEQYYTPTIIFRSTGNYGSGTSFDMALTGSSLRHYTYEGDQLANDKGTTIQTDTDTSGNPVNIKIDGSKIYVMYTSGSGSYVTRSYSQGSIIDDTPKTGECDLTHVQCTGAYPYSCSWGFEAEDASGKVIGDDLGNTFESDQPAVEMTTNTFTISGGGTARLLGNSFQNPRIKYNKLIDVQTCDVNKCQGNGYVECVNHELGNFTECPYGCKTGACLPPYQSVTVNFLDSTNTNRIAFTRNEPFRIKTNIISTVTLSGEINLKIMEENVYGTVVYEETHSFSSGVANYFEVPGFNYLKTYIVVLEVDYGLEEPVYIGRDAEYKFVVAEAFTADLIVSQNLKGRDVSTIGYTGYNIKLQDIFQGLGGQDQYPDSVDVSFTIDGGSKTQLTNPQIITGTYVYLYTPSTPGNYKFTGTATRGSYTTNPSVANFRIDPDSVVLDYDLKFNPVKNDKAYTDVVTFTTTNQNGDLVSTENTVTVKVNGVEFGTISVKGSGGHYSVDYIFTEDNADYTFIIKSSASGLVGTEKIIPSIKSSTQDETPQCTENSCGFFENCNISTGVCETNINLILIVLSSIVGVIILIVLITKFSKGKSSSSFDIGGL